MPRGDRLHIALLVESSSAGVGRHVIDLALELRRIGHSVDLLYSSRRIDARFARGLTQLGSLGGRVSEIDMYHGPHPTDILTVLRIGRYLRLNGPFDILHCHSTKAGFVGRFAGFATGVRTVYTPHAFVTMSPFRSGPYKAVAGYLERSLSMLGDGVICVSREEKEHAIEIGISEAMLHVIPNGIDLSEIVRHLGNRSAMRASLGLKDTELCVGFVGRMFPQKTPNLLLEAFALIPRGVVARAKLVFIGSGPESAALRDRITVLGLQDRVLMAGEMDGLEAMSAFDIFALPSSYEGFPYVLVEAVAMGLPIISTDVGGVSELVHEGRNGRVIKRALHQEMSVALGELLEDSGLRNRMGKASREISGRFSLPEMAAKVVQVYRKISPGVPLSVRAGNVFGN